MNNTKSTSVINGGGVSSGIGERQLTKDLQNKINACYNHLNDTNSHFIENEKSMLTLTATIESDGLMSKTDKYKLDNIETGANNYIHPRTGIIPGTYGNIKVDSTGHIISISKEIDQNIKSYIDEKINELELKMNEVYNLLSNRINEKG